MANTVVAASSGVLVPLQTTATTGGGTVVAPPSDMKNHTIYLKGNTTVSAGAVQIETADDPDYSGTWGQVGGGPITLVDATELAVSFVGVYYFIRARISTTVTGGGSLTANYLGSRP